MGPKKRDEPTTQTTKTKKKMPVQRNASARCSAMAVQCNASAVQCQCSVLPVQCTAGAVQWQYNVMQVQCNASAVQCQYSATPHPASWPATQAVRQAGSE